MNIRKVPVYKVTYDFLLFVYRNTTQVQRAYRYTLVEELKRSIQDVAVEIFRVHMKADDKIYHVIQARLHLERARLHVRLMRDLKQFSTGQCAVASDYLADIAKQLTAWEKYLKRTNEKKE